VRGLFENEILPLFFARDFLALVVARRTQFAVPAADRRLVHSICALFVFIVVVVVVVLPGLCYSLWALSLNFCMPSGFDHKVEFMVCQELGSSEVGNLTFSAMNLCTETSVVFGHNARHRSWHGYVVAWPEFVMDGCGFA
jgi:hypothetical protein